MFTVGMTSIVALLLAGMFTFLKPIHDTNEALYNKKQILGALNTPLNINADNLTDAEVEEYFKSVQQTVVDYQGNPFQAEGLKAEDVNMEKQEKKAMKDRQFPVFIMEYEGKKFYILSVRGNGLWDKIWGWIALEADVNTIAGAAFGHKAETPGLGAEIKDNAAFKKNFEGKKLYEEDGDYVSVAVRKGGVAKNDPHAIDIISGATVTSVGVSEMLYKGIKMYEPYLKTLPKGPTGQK
jgi:Na+-transporting NADH:ubiquinone oxidoreductase subunit C